MEPTEKLTEEQSKKHHLNLLLYGKSSVVFREGGDVEVLDLWEIPDEGS